jgi:hypothetical protein
MAVPKATLPEEPPRYLEKLATSSSRANLLGIEVDSHPANTDDVEPLYCCIHS